MDSLLKRVEFLRGVIEELSLNAEAVCLRAEEAGRGAMRESFDAATARAVAPLNVLCELLLPLVRVGGKAVALKGPGAAAEAEAAQNALEALGGQLFAIEEVPIPGRDWAHTLAVSHWRGAAENGEGARGDVAPPVANRRRRHRADPRARPCAPRRAGTRAVRRTRRARAACARHLPCRKAVPVTARARQRAPRRVQDCV